MATNNPKTSSYAWPIIATLVTLAAVVIMFALGLWQLDRAEHKERRLVQIEQRQQDAPVTLSTLLAIDGDNRDIGFTARGYLLSEHIFLLDNRIHQGRVGYQVLAPLETQSGLLMVNFGWVPAGKTRQDLPDIQLPSDLIEVYGIVAIPENNPMITETATPGQSWPVVIQQTDMLVFNSFLDQSVLNFVMLADEENPVGFIRDWQPVVMPPEKHIAYAIQWFGLALACMVVFIFAFKKRIKDRHE